MSIDIYEIEGLAIVDDTGQPLYQSTFSEYNPGSLYKQSIKEQEEICIIDDKLVIMKKLQDISIIIYAESSRNEIMLYKALECFFNGLIKILKTCNKKYLLKKYDLVCLFANEFIFKGIICETKHEDLLKRVPTRSFEGLETMNVPKSFLAFFSENTASIKKRSR